MSVPSYFSYRHLRSAFRVSVRGNYVFVPVAHAAATETLWRLWELEHAHGKWWQAPPSEAAVRGVDGNSPWVTIGGTELMTFVSGFQAGFRFSITRNPYTRMLAAYLTHIVQDTAVGRAFRRLSGLPADSQLDFPRFVTLLATQPRHERQPLFSPQTEWMLFDYVPYHFIGAVEQYQNAFDYVATRVTGQGSGADGRRGGHTDALRCLRTHYTIEARQHIRMLHDSDFVKFGYPYSLDDAAQVPSATGERLFQSSLYNTPFWRLVDSEVLIAQVQFAPAVKQIERTLADAEAGGEVLPDLRAELARFLLNAHEISEAEALMTSLPPDHAAIACASLHADLELRRNNADKALSILMAALRRGEPTAAVLQQVGALAAATNDVDAATAAAAVAVAAMPAGPSRNALVDALVDGTNRRRGGRLATMTLEYIETLDNTGYDVAGRMLALKQSEGTALRAVKLPDLPDLPEGQPRPAALPPAPLAVAQNNVLCALMEEAADTIEFARQRLLRKVLEIYPYLFDEDHYSRNVAGLDKSGLTPLEHYIRIGSKDPWREPNPFFNQAIYLHNIAKVAYSGDALVHYVVEGAPNGLDPGPFFITERFLRDRPDIAGTTLNPLNEYLAGGRRKLGEYGLLPGHIHRDLQETAFIDIGLFPSSWRLVNLMNDPGPGQADRLARVYKQVTQDLPETITHLVLLSWIAHPGGAERVAMFVLRMMTEQLGIDRVAVIGTDYPSRKGFEMPEGLRMVSLLDYDDSLAAHERVELIDRIIMEKKPKTTFNMNSLSGWVAMVQRARYLYRETAFYASIFGYGFNDVDGPFGFPFMFDHCKDYVSGVIVDNTRFPVTLEKLISMVQKDREKIHLVYTPYDTTLGLQSPERPPGLRQALWMSRFAPEKRMDVLGRIASRTPERQYLLYGSQIEHAPATDVSFLHELPNITIRGYFSDLSDIPYKECDVFVYTSAYDGLPVALLEATAMGLPIIAPNVGGISDLINNETGWLVSGPDAVDEYLDALKEIEADPDLVQRKVKAAQSLLVKRHSWEAFLDTYRKIPGFL
ncbi:glycosyltransferase [Azospirillum halopraeferens]|uniref:glycosyltransferase n=1 Tax=Azospirillum halopraeferens TaxID=34010 RepID=UPI00041A819B|nr:glycosyltransferase [Azospirillum halopraeferens]